MKNEDIVVVPRISWNDLFDVDGNPDVKGAFNFGEAMRLAGFAILTDAPFRDDLLKQNYELMSQIFDVCIP